MKSSTALIVIILTFSGSMVLLSGCGQGPADENAIKQVILEETQRFFARDYAGWSQTLVPDADVLQVWNNDDGTYAQAQGWDTISSNVRSFIEENPEPDKTTLRFEDFRYRFYGDAAFVTYLKYMGDAEDPTPVREIRVVEKHDGSWKIVCVAAFVDYTESVESDNTF